MGVRATQIQCSSKQQCEPHEFSVLEQTTVEGGARVRNCRLQTVTTEQKAARGAEQTNQSGKE